MFSASATEIIIGFNEILFELFNLKRWTSVMSDHRYNEAGKQSLNAFITLCLALESIAAGKRIDLTKIPKVVIGRAIRKSLTVDLQGATLEKLFELGVDREAFQQMIKSLASKKTFEDFIKFLEVPEDAPEVRLFNAARNLATYLELLEIRQLIPKQRFREKKRQLKQNLREFQDLPGMKRMMSKNSPYMAVYRAFSSTRNLGRWAKQPYILHCSDLSHQFDTGVLAYTESLERDPLDEARATQFFFWGIVHDFPEAWTGDMPSPLKDHLPGLRATVGELEHIVLEENVFRKLPKPTAEYIREIFELENDPFNKTILKGADYMSANIECWRQLVAGSKASYFVDVLKGAYAKKEELSPSMKELLKHMLEILK